MQTKCISNRKDSVWVSHSYYYYHYLNYTVFLIYMKVGSSEESDFQAAFHLSSKSLAPRLDWDHTTASVLNLVLCLSCFCACNDMEFIHRFENIILDYNYLVLLSLQLQMLFSQKPLLFSPEYLNTLYLLLVMAGPFLPIVWRCNSYTCYGFCGAWKHLFKMFFIHLLPE